MLWLEYCIILETVEFLEACVLYKVQRMCVSTCGRSLPQTLALCILAHVSLVIPPYSSILALPSRNKSTGTAFMMTTGVDSVSSKNQANKVIGVYPHSPKKGYDVMFQGR